MDEVVNYPVKYAVLELKQRGDQSVRFKEITKGFIASKCFIIESNIVYDHKGKGKIIHKVVFPYKDIEMFNNSIKNGRPNIGKPEIPYSRALNNTFKLNIVEELYDSYESAKTKARDLNEKHSKKLMRSVEDFFGDLDFKDQRENILKEFEDGLEMCYLFEQTIAYATMDMNAIDGSISDKEKTYVRVLKNNS